MKRNEIKIGGHYLARVGGKMATVRVDQVRDHEWPSVWTEYCITSLATGRKTTFRSAAKFRSEVPSQSSEQSRALQMPSSDQHQEPLEGEQCSKTTSGLAVHIAATRQTRSPGSPIAGMIPNEEQEAILDTAMTPGLRALVVAAGAGAGKTATLKMLEQVLPGRGQYTAFNTSLVAESKAKFSKAACNTTHSLAFRAVGKQYQHRLGGERVRSEHIARILGIENMTIVIEGAGEPDDDGKPTNKEKTLRAGFLAGQVMTTIKKFCQTADLEIGLQHLQPIAGADVPGERKNSDKVRNYLLQFCHKAWRDLADPDGKLPFAHDCYVKLWQMGRGDDRPIIAADYILLDEAQDTAPVFLDVIRQQKHALIVLVGDDNQQIYCQPAGTMVMVTRRAGRADWEMYEEPIESIRPGDTVATYRESWRLGRITAKGCVVSEVRRKTVDESLVEVNLSRSKCTSRYTMDHHCVVMLGSIAHGKCAVYMQKKGDHYRIGACAGVYTSQGGQIGPVVRAKQEGADTLWIIALTNTKREALDYEATLHQHVPSRCFHSSGGADWWSAQIPDEESASMILAANGLDIDEPLLRREGRWVDKSRTPIVTAARNLLDGMLMLSFDNVPYNEEDRGFTVKKDQWEQIKVGRRWYKGEVYSISVDGDHTYIADGIVTHNSWRGAVNAMGAFKDAPRRLLSQSYRFGQAIADVANTILATLEEPTDLVMRGMPGLPSRVGMVPEPKCYLYRTNAGAVSRVMVSIKAGKKPHLVGGTADVVAWCQAAMDLQGCRGTQHPELACFSNWEEVVQYSKTDEGSDMRLMVKLITDFGAAAIRDTLKNMPKEENADLVVSTTHKSKGREWDTVKLGPDFPTVNKMSDADRRLLYVAATRAKLTLDVSECPPFCGGTDKSKGDSDGTGNGGWVPGLRVKYTSPMPTADEQAAWNGDGKRSNGTTTYTKLRNGKWGIRSTTEVKDGQLVTVTTRAGVEKQETVGRVLWSGDGVWLAEVV